MNTANFKQTLDSSADAVFKNSDQFFRRIESFASMDIVDNVTEPYLKPILANPTVGFFVALGLMVYIVFIADNLNKRVVKMLRHPVVKFLFLFIILVLSRRSPSLAILLTIAVLSTYHSNDVELMTNVSGTTVKGDCKCVEWECDEADGNTMTFDHDMGHDVVPANDPINDLHHPSPEEMHDLHDVTAEDHAVQVVVEEKAKMEEQLQRPLTQEELQDLCAKVGSSMNEPQQAAVESFDDVAGFSGSAYASAN